MRTAVTAITLAAIGLGAWAGAAGASHSEGQGPRADFVQGSARLPESSGGGLFHFNARSGPSGEDPRGMYFAKDGLFGLATFTSRVECLEVNGNEAFIGTRVTRSQEGPPENASVVFRVVDNGSPGAGKDQFVGIQGIDSTTDCRNPALQAALIAASQTISEGNFTVHDGQP